MALGEKYREIILDRIQSRTGYALNQQQTTPGQWRRILDLTSILHQAMIIEQMTKVEERSGNKLSSRVSTKIRPSRRVELNETLSTLSGVKEKIWLKCDVISSEISQGLPGPEDGDDNAFHGTSNLMRCHACGGNVSVLAYNNFRCSSCGLGYSAKDYLENLAELVEKV